MVKKYLGNKTKRFFFNNGEKDTSYVAIYGDEFEVDQGQDNTSSKQRDALYRGRNGKISSNTILFPKRELEFYFLDVDQGDAAYIVTPNNIKILVDGGLRDRALGFLIWKYRLDQPNNTVVINHLFLSHADGDHVEGLIPLLEHPQITVNNIYHNGIALFNSGHNEVLGTVNSGRLITLHNTINELDNEDLKDDYQDWIDAVKASGANYKRLDSSDSFIDIGDNDIKLEILGPILQTDQSLKWLKNKSHTINGHSLIFRIDYEHVRTFFSGDLNIEGSDHIMSIPGNILKVNAHIFKAPHHGSHEFSQELLNAINPMVSVISSGEVPDHGHPRAIFLGGLGKSGRGIEPLIFSTELAALFVDAGDPEAKNHINNLETTMEGLDFIHSSANKVARQRFKKLLPGIINVRTNGKNIYSFRRVQMGYQWESYKQKFVN